MCGTQKEVVDVGFGTNIRKYHDETVSRILGTAIRNHHHHHPKEGKKKRKKTNSLSYFNIAILEDSFLVFDFIRRRCHSLFYLIYVVQTVVDIKKIHVVTLMLPNANGDGARLRSSSSIPCAHVHGPAQCFDAVNSLLMTPVAADKYKRTPSRCSTYVYSA